LSIFGELKRRNVLRVGAAYLAGSWLLIQIADTLLAFFELPEAAGRVLVTVLAIGFVPALLVAWLFELTPEGFKRESGVSHGSAESVRATRRFDRAIIGVLAVAVVVFAVDRFVLDPARDARLVADALEHALTSVESNAAPDEPSIAVLAFDDLSPDGDQEYFSDGVSIELMELLTKIPDLRVIGRESAFWFKGKDASYAEIGETLGVSRLLGGTVRVAGDQVRVTASLIDPGTSAQVWSYSPEPRPMTDLFAIQTEIASEVVDELRIELAGEFPAVDETTPEVHALYLQARRILEPLDTTRFALARELLERAVELDPDYFPAQILLSGAYQGLMVTGQLDGVEAERLQSTTMERAALKWPDRVEIKYFRAGRAIRNGDFATATRYLQLALEQDPDSIRDAAAIAYLLELIRFDEAIDFGEALIRNDPICATCYANLRRAYYAARRYDDAIAVTERAMSFGLELPADNRYAAALLLNGDAEAALAEYERDSMDPGSRVAGRAMAYHALGRTAESEAALAEVTERFRGALPFVNAYLGKVDEALEILSGYRRLPPLMLNDPLLDKLREHPRYAELLEKAGVGPDGLLEGIEFDYELPE
jgi:adenylate cyclase